MTNRDVVVKNAALDQLIDGLSCYGVLSLLRENPSLRVLLDIPREDKDLAADFIAGVLKPSYSVLGSNGRAREELMVVTFQEFLQCVKKLRETFGDRTLTKDEEAFLKALSPGHILAFATASAALMSRLPSNNPRLVWQGLQSITNYEGSTPVTTTADASLAEELNTFFPHGQHRPPVTAHSHSRNTRSLIYKACCVQKPCVFPTRESVTLDGNTMKCS